MLKIRKSQQRGKADHGWLKSFHSFSFADYFDRNHMHFQTLRVINEDYIAPNMGFGTHPHNDMEIITYVLSGNLAHKDSMGNTEIIKAGEFQVMTAGSGITHSEFNPSKDTETHLLQIWILPNKKGLTPSYAELKPEDKNELSLIISPEGPLKVNQDIKLYLGKFKKGQNLKREILDSRHIWLQLIEGELLVNGQILETGDAAALSDEKNLELNAQTNCHFLLFDLNTWK